MNCTWNYVTHLRLSYQDQLYHTWCKQLRADKYILILAAIRYSRIMNILQNLNNLNFTQNICVIRGTIKELCNPTKELPCKTAVTHWSYSSLEHKTAVTPVSYCSLTPSHWYYKSLIIHQKESEILITKANGTHDYLGTAPSYKYTWRKWALLSDTF